MEYGESVDYEPIPVPRTVTKTVDYISNIANLVFKELEALVCTTAAGVWTAITLVFTLVISSIILGSFALLAVAVYLGHSQNNLTPSTLFDIALYPSAAIDTTCQIPYFQRLPLCQIRAQNSFSSYDNTFVLSDGKIDGLRQAALSVHSFSQDLLRIKSNNVLLIPLIGHSNDKNKTLLIRELRKLPVNIDKLEESVIQFNAEMMNVVRQRLSQSQLALGSLYKADQFLIFLTKIDHWLPISKHHIFLFHSWRRSSELHLLPIIINGLIDSSRSRLTHLSSKASTILRSLRQDTNLIEGAEKLCSNDRLCSGEPKQFRSRLLRIWESRRRTLPHMKVVDKMKHSYATIKRFTNCMQTSISIMQTYDESLAKFGAVVEALILKRKEEQERYEYLVQNKMPGLMQTRNQESEERVLNEFFEKIVKESRALEEHQKSCVYPVGWRNAASVST